ncbi:uncharacterized protein LOC128923463 [Zeugodacus cucurbitae]|uniref:uncharacterized protein LOC128923463 n=1 Tax=Zeugodacus cucurbitae TaxID=28588 RepID=UPI0023D937AB|nr:uncharacterized protein LOC128923463 [Zeugodacus cucurbitae]
MEEESEKLNSPVTQLLVRSRLDLEPEFAGGRRKKSVLWGKVVDNMRLINPEVSQTKEFMQRKFLNLFATYKRIKKRNDATGRGATTWEYFKDFDSVFGNRHSIESVLWGKVVDNMRLINPEVSQTKEFMQRKFLNLFATYKRIKKRNDATGRGATTWEYFKDFDSVFGNRHSIEPPIRNLQSSLQSLVESGVSEEERCAEESEAEGVSRKKRPKTIASETLDFFKEEARKEQIRHEETMLIEKEKLLVDKERIKAMLDLRQVLEGLCQK